MEPGGTKTRRRGRGWERWGLGTALLLCALSSHADTAPSPTLTFLSSTLYPSQPEAVLAKDADPWCSLCPCPITAGAPEEVREAPVFVDILTDESESTHVTPALQTALGFDPATGEPRWTAYLQRTLTSRNVRVQQRCVGLLGNSTSTDPFLDKSSCFSRRQTGIYSPIVETLDKLRDEKKNLDPNSKQIIVFLTDSHQSLPAKHPHKSTHTQPRVAKAVQDLIALRQVRLLLVMVQGDPKVPPVSNLCGGHPRCWETAPLILPSTGDVDLSHYQPLLLELDADLKAAERSFSHRLLQKTGPGESFTDAVLVGGDARYHCSGVALDAHSVLTAGHCLPATRIHAGEGEREQGSTYAVAQSLHHPDPREDIGLLFTHEPMNVAPKLRRRLDQPEPPTSLLRHVGFGAIDSAGLRGFGRKKSIDLFASGWGCDGARVVTTGCRPGLEMVLPGSSGGDTCSGDSGGPLYEIWGDGASCGYRLVAITSRRVADANAACGSGGIYARVDAADDWISAQMKRWNEGHAKPGEGR